MIYYICNDKYSSWRSMQKSCLKINYQAKDLYLHKIVECEG
jgi:hypothetical protein